MFYPCIHRVNTGGMDAEAQAVAVPRSQPASRDHEDATRSVRPVLEPRPNGLADRFSQRFGPDPGRVLIVALLAGWALLVAAMVFLGLVLIDVLLPLGGLGRRTSSSASGWPTIERRRRRTSRGSGRRSPEGT